ncbi:MAG: hypothetical protein IJ693_08760 [Bacteroidaceae bacterium]|nr:hypothetical protein [Bacteroidaceae bacterium]
MATLVLQVPDESLVSKVKQACKMFRGVESVKVQKTTASPKTKSSYLRSQEDKLAGRVEKFSSSEDMFKSLDV